MAGDSSVCAGFASRLGGKWPVGERSPLGRRSARGVAGQGLMVPPAGYAGGEHMSRG